MIKTTPGDIAVNSRPIAASPAKAPEKPAAPSAVSVDIKKPTTQQKDQEKKPATLPKILIKPLMK
jgi:hypothetical protein